MEICNILMKICKTYFECFSCWFAVETATVDVDKMNKKQQTTNIGNWIDQKRKIFFTSNFR